MRRRINCALTDEEQEVVFREDRSFLGHFFARLRASTSARGGLKKTRQIRLVLLWDGE